MIPCTVAYVYAGAAAADLPALLAIMGFGESSDGGDPSSRWSAFSLLFGLVLLLVLMWLAMAYTRRALARFAVSVTPTADVTQTPQDQV